MTSYAAERADALEMITEFGADLTFRGAILGTPAVYDPLTDTFSGGTDPSDVVGKAIQVPDDPEQFATLGLVLANPITLLVAASGLGFTPQPGTLFVWSSKTYATKNAEALAPDGTPILYTLIGDA